MGMSIRSNIASLTSQRNLYATQNALDSSLSKLSSGYRITKAGDDAAGLGVAANINAQAVSYAQAIKNTQDGLWLVQTAEGAMNEIESMVTRMRELAMQSASAGISNTERVYVQNENDSLVIEIDRIANSTEYNGVNILDGVATALTYQVGIRNVAANDQIVVTTSDVTTATLGVNALVVTDAVNAAAALSTLDTALNTLSLARASMGAFGTRLQHAIATTQTTYVNTEEAHSRIKDVDVAEESSRLTRSQILLQAGVSTLAQANQIPQIALKLLQ